MAKVARGKHGLTIVVLDHEEQAALTDLLVDYTDAYAEETVGGASTLQSLRDELELT